MELLTDEECDKLRRLPGSFNDMLRAVHYGGYMKGAQEAIQSVQSGDIESAVARLEAALAPTKGGNHHREAESRGTKHQYSRLLVWRVSEV